MYSNRTISKSYDNEINDQWISHYSKSSPPVKYSTSGDVWTAAGTSSAVDTPKGNVPARTQATVMLTKEARTSGLPDDCLHFSFLCHIFAVGKKDKPLKSMGQLEQLAICRWYNGNKGKC